METVDLESGEIVEDRRWPRMPPEIAKAVVAVMKQVKQLGQDSRNEHGRYSYASVDAFLAAVRPLMAEAAIFLVPHEDSVEIREGRRIDERTGAEKITSYLFMRFAMEVIHESGASWGPVYRSLAIPATGPQAYGAAESYVMKRFMRALFQIPTGDADADETPAGQVPARQQRRRDAPSKANPAVARPNDATEQARAAYQRVNRAIQAAQTAGAILLRLNEQSGELTGIFDPVTEEWGPDVSADIATIAAVNEQHVKGLRDRAIARLAALEGAP